VSGSFWSRFAHIDDESDPSVMLEFLDQYADLAPAREQKRQATDALELQPGERVLDVGCGTGVDLAAMTQRVAPGGEVVGIDSSAFAVERAEARLEGISASAIVADAHALPFRDDTFDACRADRTLQHLAQPDVALAEIARVLRPGGRLVVLEVLTELGAPEGSEAAGLLEAARRYWTTPDERKAWLPAMLPLLLARTGFVDVQIGVIETSSTDPDVVAAMLALNAQTRGSEEDGRLRESAGGDGIELKMRGVRLLARTVG
jgi:ubiquinone/menaquinone biosynthesis C-methylase UbiE